MLLSDLQALAILFSKEDSEFREWFSNGISLKLIQMANWCASLYFLVMIIVEPLQENDDSFYC